MVEYPVEELDSDYDDGTMPNNVMDLEEAVVIDEVEYNGN